MIPLPEHGPSDMSAESGAAAGGGRERGKRTREKIPSPLEMMQKLARMDQDATTGKAAPPTAEPPKAAAAVPPTAAPRPAQAPAVPRQQPAAALHVRQALDGPPRMPGALQTAPGIKRDPMSIKQEAMERERHEKHIQEKLVPTKRENTLPSDAAQKPMAAKSPALAVAGITPPPQAPSG